MREVIRQALVNGIPEVEGRIFEPHTAAADTKKPYLIIRELAENDNTEWAGYRCRVEVWPYCEQSSYVEVDTLAKKVNDCLDKRLLGSDDSEAVTCISDGSSSDVVDKEWDALTRCVNFYVLAVQPANMQGPIINDPWVNALNDWSKKILGDMIVDCYGGILPTGYKRPSILWRVNSMEVEECGRFGFDVIKQLTCHVFGRNSVEEMNIATKLIAEMQSTIKIPLSIPDCIFMLVRNVKGDFCTNALKQGHITATLSRKTRRPQADVPLMEDVKFKGILNKSISS